MRLFRRRRALPTKPRLLDPIQGGQRIEFDDDERIAVNSKGAFVAKGFQDMHFTEEDASSIEKGLVALPALLDVAKSRLAQGDYRGAASSCAKAIGLAGDNPSCWFLLSEVLIEYGDLARAEGFIEEAERAASKLGLGREYRDTYQRLRDRIELKLAGLSGDEDPIAFLQAAELNIGIGDVPQAQKCLDLAESAAVAEELVDQLEASGVIQRVRKRVAKGS